MGGGGGGGAYTTFRIIVEFRSFYMLESVVCDDLFPNCFLCAVGTAKKVCVHDKRYILYIQ